jgi:large subunit ribosomal protein L15
MRIPKLRGFRSINRIDYQVVNIGRISAYAEAGRLGELLTPRSPYTVNPEILRAAGLITKERVPVKILGNGEVSVPMFVLADAFTASARSKIEAAGGTLQSLMPEKPRRDEPAATTAATAADAPAAESAGDPTELDGGSADTATGD